MTKTSLVTHLLFLFVYLLFSQGTPSLFSCLVPEGCAVT